MEIVWDRRSSLDWKVGTPSHVILSLYGIIAYHGRISHFRNLQHIYRSHTWQVIFFCLHFMYLLDRTAQTFFLNVFIYSLKRYVPVISHEMFEHYKHRVCYLFWVYETGFSDYIILFFQTVKLLIFFFSHCPVGMHFSIVWMKNFNNNKKLFILQGNLKRYT